MLSVIMLVHSYGLQLALLLLVDAACARMFSSLELM